MRAVEKRRPPLIGKKQWIALVMFFIIAIAVLSVLFYRSIQLDHWSEQSDITARLKAETEVSSIEYIEKYIWETPVWMIKAIDQSDEAYYYAWQDDQVLASLSVHNIVTEEAMEEKIIANMPEAKEISIAPGYAWGLFIWEVHYFSTESQHYQYAFYEMSTGQHITEYTIPNKGTAQK